MSKFPKYTIASKSAPKILLASQIIISFVYLTCILFVLQKGELFLFLMLAISEVFHVWLIVTLIYTIWPRDSTNEFDINYTPSVDIFVTVVNEPIHIIQKTIQAAKRLNYPNFAIYILNDGMICGNKEWELMEELASSEGVKCMTRTIKGGAKAGNINSALKQTTGEYIAVFDADHAPYNNFLQKTIPYFVDKKMAFVQSPQYYKNFLNNEVTLGASQQQELFFGPIMTGKNNLNSAFMCGTNMVVRRQSIDDAGGFDEVSIAEDFLTSLQLHRLGWKSKYIGEVLAEGLAPEDFLSYSKQQFRWARGSMDILIWHNPIFCKGLTFAQKLSYLISGSYYLSGIIILFNMTTPLVFLFTGLEPLRSSSMILPAVFLPYIILGALVLNISTNCGYTFRALAFSNGSFWIFVKAFWAVIINQKSSFEVTSKQKLQGNYIMLIWPHFLYIGIGIIAISYALVRSGLNPANVTNISWVVFNMVSFLPFVIAALPEYSMVSVFQKLKSKLRIRNSHSETTKIT